MLTADSGYRPIQEHEEITEQKTAQNDKLPASKISKNHISCTLPVASCGEFKLKAVLKTGFFIDSHGGFY